MIRQITAVLGESAAIAIARRHTPVVGKNLEMGVRQLLVYVLKRVTAIKSEASRRATVAIRKTEDNSPEKIQKYYQ